MDLDALERRLKALDKENFMAWKNPEPGQPARDDSLYRDQKKRLARTRTALFNHRTWQKRRATREGWRTDTLAEMVRAQSFLEHKRFLCWDLEFFKNPYPGWPPISEVGFVVLDRGKIVRHGNLRPPCYRNRRVGWTYDFGHTQYRPTRQIEAILRQQAERADFFVGHTLGGDISLLGDLGWSIPERQTFDIGLWSRGLYHTDTGTFDGLEQLAQKWGVATPMPHIAGNDAAYTIHTFLAMCRSAKVDEL